MCKLWNMFGPCRSYFGEKDWQQLVMFERLVELGFRKWGAVGRATV